MHRRAFIAGLGAAMIVTITATNTHPYGSIIPDRNWSAGPMKTRLNLDATFLSNWPAQPWLTQVKYAQARTPISYGGKTIYVSEIHYEVLGSRWKRLFVFQPTMKPATMSGGSALQGTRPHFMVCLPGSNDAGDGAWDLLDLASPTYQYNWPLAVAADNDLICVAIDGPLWGSFEYPAFPTNPYDVLIDDICGIEAAKWYMDNTGAFAVYGMQPIQKNFYVGGYSWGSIRASFLGSACRDCTAMYLASGHMSKAYDTRPVFNPAEWGPLNKDYADMLLASKAKKVRISFGGNGTDYTYTPFQPGIDTIINGLVNADPAKFSKIITPGIGHAVNLGDIRSFFQNNVSPCLFYHAPEYIPE